MTRKALLIGNTDGIGLSASRKLIEQNWLVWGISRSPSSIQDPHYSHTVIDIRDPNYSNVLASVLSDIDVIDLCLYCAGIGELLNLEELKKDIAVFAVNLLGLVHTTAVVIPKMLQQNSGHLIGLSSVADDMLSPEAPSYHASKAGFSNYLEGLGLALKDKSVAITNIRFGFVDTKMAKGDVKPFMMTVDQAVEHIIRCIDKKPIRYTVPKIVIPLVKFRKWMLRLAL